MAGDPDLTMAAIRVDLPLDRVDVADRRIVEMLAPEIRLEGAQESLARSAIAGDDPGLDQGRPFPVLSVSLVVLLGVLDRQRERMARRMRPQAHRERHRALPAAIAEPRRLEQDDQIDVAGVIELERAELAHPEHDDARFLLRAPRVGELDVA